MKMFKDLLLIIAIYMGFVLFLLWPTYSIQWVIGVLLGPSLLGFTIGTRK